MWALKFNIAFNPSFISEWLNDLISNYHTTTFINLNASKTPYVFKGKKQTKPAFYYAFAKGNLSITMVLLTIGPFCSFTVYSDYNKIKNPKMFVELFKKHLKN